MLAEAADMNNDGFDPAESLFDSDMPEGFHEVEDEPEVLDELDGLLGESTGLKAGSVELSLDELLTESVKAVSEADEVKELRGKLVHDTGGLNAEERKELQRRIDEWEMVNVWERAASVAVFHKQVCTGCGQCREVFRHFMIRCNGRKNVEVQRWFRVEQYDWHLPREVIFTTDSVVICAECACFEGFNLGEGGVKAHGEF